MAWAPEPAADEVKVVRIGRVRNLLVLEGIFALLFGVFGVLAAFRLRHLSVRPLVAAEGVLSILLAALWIWTGRRLALVTDSQQARLRGPMRTHTVPFAELVAVDFVASLLGDMLTLHLRDGRILPVYGVAGVSHKETVEAGRVRANLIDVARVAGAQLRPELDLLATIRHTRPIATLTPPGPALFVWPLAKSRLLRSMVAARAAWYAGLLAIQFPFYAICFTLLGDTAARTGSVRSAVFVAIVCVVLFLMFLASVCSPFLIARRQFVAAGDDWIGVRALGGWRTLGVADIREIVTKDTTVLVGLRSRPAVNRKLLLTASDGRTLALEREPAELGMGALLANGLHPATSLTPEAAELLRTLAGGGGAGGSGGGPESN